MRGYFGNFVGHARKLVGCQKQLSHVISSLAIGPKDFWSIYLGNCSSLSLSVFEILLIFE
jgi:hypothetical protein